MHLQVNGTDTTKLGMTDLSNCKYVTMNNHSTALDKTTYTDWCPHPDETGKVTLFPCMVAQVECLRV